MNSEEGRGEGWRKLKGVSQGRVLPPTFILARSISPFHSILVFHGTWAPPSTSSASDSAASSTFFSPYLLLLNAAYFLFDC